jgi:hypothetical protein
MGTDLAAAKKKIFAYLIAVLCGVAKHLKSM